MAIEKIKILGAILEQTKYASAVPKNLGFDFRPYSKNDFLTGRP